MATPDFVLALREKVGHEPLWLSGVTAVVSHGESVLMVRRSDNGAWTPVTGIIDPGEEPAAAAAREVLEETGVVAVAERLAWVHTHPMITYRNGDQAQYLDLTFHMRYVSGDPYPADGENTEARWFPLTELPDMSDDMGARIRRALDDVAAARFEV
jgi:8-oxo-dGTP pyrophosphatase MutT (NUDIX family)